MNFTRKIYIPGIFFETQGIFLFSRKMIHDAKFNMEIN